MLVAIGPNGTVGSMDADDRSTRDKLLDAATRLMAEQGIYGASLAEIVREAGQRNASAVHYHFGSRDEVLRAILERHVPVIRARRLELAEGADDLRSLAEAMVRPITEFAQRGWRERAYLQIGSELTRYVDRTTPEVRALLEETAGYEVMARIAELAPPLPPAVWAERTAIIHPFVGRAAADRATAGGLDDDAFVDNLVDMFLGALTAPATATGSSRRRSATRSAGSGRT